MCKLLPEGTDLNDIFTNGMYFLKSGLNMPNGYLYLIVMGEPSVMDKIQFGFSIVDAKIHYRKYNNNNWEAWLSTTLS